MKLVRYIISNYRRKLISCLVYALIANSIAGGGLFFLQGVFKGASFDNEQMLLTSLVAKYVICIVASSCLVQLFEVSIREFENRFRSDLELKIYGKVSRASWEYFNKQNRGSLLNIFQNGIYRLVEAASAIIYIVSDTVFVLIFIGVGLYINAFLTIFVALIGGGAFVLSILSKKEVYSLGKELNQSYMKFSEYIEESLSNMKLTHVLDNQSRDLKELKKIEQQILHHNKQFSRKKSKAQLVSIVGSSVVCLISIYVGYTYLKLPFANIILLMFIYFQLLKRMQLIQYHVFRFRHIEPIFTDIEKYMNLDERLVRDTQKMEKVTLHHSFNIRDISYAYADTYQPILNGISLEFKKGELTIISGPSGCGKSTLLDLLCGVAKVDSGQFFIDGSEVNIYNNSAWKNILGFVPQESFFSQKTILENIRYAKADCTIEEAYEALRLANVEEHVLRLPDKIHSIMGFRGGFLSGGEKQRVSLARALVKKPKVLLLDEASSALDEESQTAFIKTLNQLKKDMVIVFVTHQQRLATYADRHYFLSHDHQKKNQKEYALCSQ